MTEKLTGDFNEKDWLEVFRRGEWHSDFEQATQREYLGVSSIGDIVVTENATSVAQSIVLRYVLDDFLKENNYTVNRVVCLGHDGEYAPSYSNVEYAPNKHKSCLNVGAMLIQRGDLKFIFILEPIHEAFMFRALGRKDGSVSTKDLMDAFIEYGKQHNFLKGKKIDAECNFIKFDREYTWDDLILTDDLKDDIRRNLKNVIGNRDIYKKNNLTIKRGLIFSGPPGCGKSTLGKVLCTTIDWTFVWVTPKHLIYPKHISNIVDMCKELAPTVLFLEDIDLFGGARETNGNPALLGEFMNQLDGIQENKDIITLATTNKAEVLEKALLDRPGRFDKVLEFKAPDDKSRLKMLTHFAKGLNLDKDIDLKAVAKTVAGKSGAHVRELVNLAVIYAIDGQSYNEEKVILVKAEHFEKALEVVKKKDFNKLGFEVSSRRGGFDIDD